MSDLLHNWEKKAAARQKDYRNFLEKADRPAQRNRILPQLPELHEEAFRKIDCLQCANCCKRYSPRFKTPDIKRIARHLQLKGKRIHRPIPAPGRRGGLRRQIHTLSFLGSDNRCGIYDVRPSDCERFPYTDEDVLVKRPALTLKNSTFCPIVYWVLERLME